MPNYSILGGNRGIQELYQRPELSGVSQKPKQPITSDPNPPKSGVRVKLSSSDQVQGLAQEYDVRNMSPKQMSQMSQQLFDSGLISFEDHALLSFQPEMNYETQQILPGNPEQPKDFIQQWEEQRQFHLKEGNHNFAQKDQKMLNLLQNLESLNRQQVNLAETAETT